MIEEELRAELKDALKSKDTARSNVIRAITTEVQKRKAEPGFAGVVDDALYLEVMASFAKKMDKARREYEGYGERGAEQAAKLAFEVEYVSKWLPTKLDEDATRALVEQVVDELGVAGDPSATGRVMGTVMKAHKDDLDGAVVNRIVREVLAG
ncbi:MAG: GatB/YqeY domain-containing protein [Acidimicrobiia bacterium]|nr:MAG: GatB/YqeY domain-containing protein [Acidimicrobiia bacterium]